MNTITDHAEGILALIGVDASNPFALVVCAIICPLLIAVIWGAVLPAIVNDHEKKRDR